MWFQCEFVRCASELHKADEGVNFQGKRPCADKMLPENTPGLIFKCAKNGVNIKDMHRTGGSKLNPLESYPGFYSKEPI